MFYESIDLFDLPFLDSLFFVFFLDDDFLGGATRSSPCAFHLRLRRGWEFQVCELLVSQAVFVEVGADNGNS